MNPKVTNSLKNKPSKTIEENLDAWNDVRHYSFSHAASEKTRYGTNHNKLSYEFALAMHANPARIELLKKSFLLNGNPPELLGHQLLFAMQSAIYPCCFFIDKRANKLTGLQNFDFIKNKWREVFNEINGQLKSDPVRKYVEKMERHLVSAETLFPELKNDLLLQLLFVPFYKEQLNKDQQHITSFEWQHAHLGSHIVQGTLETKVTDGHFGAFKFSAIKDWTKSGQIDLIHNKLKKVYDIKLLRSFDATTTFRITYKIDMRNESLQSCQAYIETRAGNYYHDKDEFFISHIKNTEPIPDPAFPSYKTIELAEHPAIIA